jgi:hypothetical protein
MAVYRVLYPTLQEVPNQPIHIEFTPKGAQDAEKATIDIKDATAATPLTIKVAEAKLKEGGVMPAILIKLMLFVVGAVALFVIKGTAKELVGRVSSEYQNVQQGTRYAKLATPTADVALRWAGPEADLEQAGFGPLFDYTVTSVDFKNCTRLMHKASHEILAQLQHAEVQGTGYDWLDLTTYFQDGTTVTTSTSRFAEGQPRPSDFPMYVLGEGTIAGKVLSAHHAHHHTGHDFCHVQRGGESHRGEAQSGPEGRTGHARRGCRGRTGRAVRSGRARGLPRPGHGPYPVCPSEPARARKGRPGLHRRSSHRAHRHGCHDRVLYVSQQS